MDKIPEPDGLHLVSLLVVVSIALSGFNAYQVSQLKQDTAEAEKVAAEPRQTRRFAFPTGTPSVYGEELDVKYQDVSRDTPQKAQKTLEKFSSKNSIELSESQKQRYIEILYRMNGGISCEYCCEAQAVITENGEPGCGCAHAAAMRGLTKYLLKNHGEMSDSEIFAEVAKWKVRYFPEQTRSKAEGLKQRGVKTSYVNLASNEYRGVSASGGKWIGDC